MTALTPLDTLWLTEAVRLREEQAGPLEDLEANRRATASAGDLPSRIKTRALWLAERDGMLTALRHWKQGARLALIALAIFSVISGAGLAFAALGDGQAPVNVFWALGSLLGLNLILLCSWALSFSVSGQSTASLGRIWLWLSEKLARDAQAAQIAPALLVLLQRQRLNRWALGALIHSMWLLALVSALVLLLMLMATRRYGFVWETTILGSDTFVTLTQNLGIVPGLIGFSVPSETMIRASGDSALLIESGRQAWAAWLVGVLLIYGIVPRLLLALLCLWRWRSGRDALRLDLTLPGYSQLRERLMPSSERLGVSDTAPEHLHHVHANSGALDSNGALLVAIELDDEQPWPPQLPPTVVDAGILDSRESRLKLLDQLTRFPPARLLIACDPRRSPDRGSLALIAELMRCAGATRVWLLPAPTGQSLDAARVSDWRTALQQLELPHSEQPPLTWLESGNE
ncbi:membrane protein [Paucimonas lemoignei]|nr:membrane protein [Paucimonas lemoignei]